MLISSIQAAEILNVQYTSMGNFVERGELKDYGITQDGKKRHYLKFNLKEIREFAKTYHKKSHINHLSNNSHQDSKPIQSLSSQLNRIEDKLDELLKIWS